MSFLTILIDYRFHRLSTPGLIYRGLIPGEVGLYLEVYGNNGILLSNLSYILAESY